MVNLLQLARGVLVLTTASFAISTGNETARGMIPQTGADSTNTVPPNQAAVDRDFTISADPEVEVLEVRIRGGYRLESFTYSLYGDGQLVKARTTGGNGVESEQVQLEFVKMMDLLGIAVDGGLMEWDSSRISQEMIERIGGVPSSSDDRTVDVSIRLETYSPILSGKKSQPVTKTFSTSSPALLYRKVPEVVEIEAVHRLMQRLQEYF